MWEGLGGLVHTAGRGRHFIPVPPDPPHLLWTPELPSRPRSFLPVEFDMRVGTGTLPVSPPVLSLRPTLVSSPNRRPTLPEAGRVFCRPELHLAPECRNEMSCDDTGRHPVLRRRMSWIEKGQSRLFD